MGKLTVDHNNRNNNNNHDDDTRDSELKTLIDKCNVCHSDLSISERGVQFCRQHDNGELSVTHFATHFFLCVKLPQILIDFTSSLSLSIRRRRLNYEIFVLN